MIIFLNHFFFFFLLALQIDILINNAGVMACPESRTSEGFEMQVIENDNH